VAHFDVFLRLVESFVGRGEGAEEEPAAGDQEEDGEDEDRSERLQDLAASASRAAA
jgi:hypothetical protein